MKKKGAIVSGGLGWSYPRQFRQCPIGAEVRDLTEKITLAKPRRAGSRSDVFTPQKRSAVMARIRGSGNRDTELRLIAIFRAHEITGWRRKQAVVGKPDFVFPRERLAVLVDGCFWHGCPVHATWPKNNAEFWLKKILGNQRRDRAVNRLLKKAGWRVLRIWEHDLAKKREARTVARVMKALENARALRRGRSPTGISGFTKKARLGARA